MVIGHKKQIESLNNSLGREKVSQAYIFSGPERLGKFLIAKIFAWSLIEGKTDLVDGFIKAQSKDNVDLEILNPEIIEKKGVTKIKDIDVDRVREAQKNLALFPASGKKRVLIINDAHRLNISAQNALLKALEEPNSSSVIIMITHREGKILKTIKSRCQRINFNLVPFDEIRNFFDGKIDGSTLDKVTIFSMGKPGEAKIMIENVELITEKEEAFKELKSLSQMSISKKFDLAQEFSKNIGKTISRMEFWIWMMRFYSYRNISNKDSLETNYKAIGLIEDALTKIKKTGLNNRLILENLFLNL